jgi:hypothetical protein
VRVAESIPLTIYRAEALAGVAARIGGRDPALARTLIDRALALCLDQPEEFRSWSNFGGRTTAAAWVAYEARRAGYADMASVTARVLATRPTSRYGHSPRDVAETLVKAAAALSLSDPGTARLVLAQAAPPAQPLSPELTDRREWLFACALADPERAVALVDRRIEAAKQSATGLSGSGLTELCQLLSAPPGPERVRLLSLYGSVGLMRDED